METTRKHDGVATDPTTATGPVRAAPGTLIAAHRVSKSYPLGRASTQILHEVSLDVSEGEVCAVMGPSGSGKSTLMYCLAGLERPESGGVSLAGRSLGDLGRTQLARLRCTDVGFVFQSYNLMPTLTGYENVALPFRLRGERPDRARILAALDSTGVGHLAAAKPPSMSGGEQQRIALARVIASSPRIVFADEPTGALDVHSGGVVIEQLCAVGRSDGRCVLLVTHDPSVAASCDRVVFMLDGRLVEQRVAPSAADVAAVLTRLTQQSVRREGVAA